MPLQSASAPHPSLPRGPGYRRLWSASCPSENAGLPLTLAPMLGQFQMSPGRLCALAALQTLLPLPSQVMRVQVLPASSILGQKPGSC